MSFVKNNTKISIINKKTGDAFVVVDTENNAGDRLSCGFPVTESVDGSLDTMTLILKGTTTKKLFDPFDLVELEIADNFSTTSRQMVVLFDSSKIFSKIKKTFDHTVLCIETVKLLEKIKIFNLILTNPEDSLLKQFQKAVNNAEPILKTEVSNSLGITSQVDLRKQRIVLSDRLRSFLAGHKSRDFYFGNTDFRSVLDAMLYNLNARAEVDEIVLDELGDIEYIFVGYRSLNLEKKQVCIWDEENQGAIINEELENDGQNYAGKIVAIGYNSITQKPITFTDCFKSNHATISDSTATAFLPFPVSEKGFVKFDVKADFYYQDSGGGHSGIMTVNIAPYILPIEHYNLLSEEKKREFLAFSFGDSFIDMGKSYKSFLWTNFNIEKVLIKAAKDIIPGKDNWAINEGFTFWNAPFTCTYYPILDTVSEITKPGVYDKDEVSLAVMDTQMERTLDIDRHGKRLASVIKRMGNAEYYLDVKATYYSKLLPLQAKISIPKTDIEEWSDEGYVVYKKDVEISDRYVKCRYYLSKDYSAVIQEEGVNREKHLYDIPLESEDVPLLVKKYLIFSDEAPTKKTTYSSNILTACLNTLIGKNSFTVNGQEVFGKIEYMLFQTVCLGEVAEGVFANLTYPQLTALSDGSTPFTDKKYRFMRPIGCYSHDRVMTVTARTLDNYSVDFSRDGYSLRIWGDGGYKVTYNRYVAAENKARIGEFSSVKLDLAFSYSDYSNVSAVQQFPVVDREKFVLCNDYAIEYSYQKDRVQRPLFAFSFECIPSKKCYRNIIIGSEFVKNNYLINGNGQRVTGLRLISSEISKFEGDETIIPQDYLYEVLATMSEENGYFSVMQTSNFCTLLLNTANVPTTFTSWAIVDDNNNIYLAANGPLRNIYLTIRDFPE